MYAISAFRVNSAIKSFVYFNTHGDDWKSYAGWKFSDNYPNCVIIHYGYYDWRDQYESGDEVIPMDVLIEFSKHYENDN
jgi:hypothetical protein